MKLDIVNGQNEKIGALELNDDLFGGRVKNDLIWESVVQENASERRGTHATKNRALVSGGGIKPYKQKGTGRPRSARAGHRCGARAEPCSGPSRAAMRSSCRRRYGVVPCGPRWPLRRRTAP